MQFLIADTFTGSLGKLTGEEQKAAKTAAFDLQVNPAHPSFQLHKIEKSKDQNFWSVRVSRDVRLIVHKTGASMLLCYVGHHDQAYDWAERRRLETHPKTGAAQMVEIRERVQEIVVPRYREEEAPKPAKPKLFANVPEDRLLVMGVPVEWLADVRAADEDSLLELADHLPGEAAEALLNLATGTGPAGTPLILDHAVPMYAPLGKESAEPEPTVDVKSSPSVIGAAGAVLASTLLGPAGFLLGAGALALRKAFNHPDAMRRFRPMKDAEELRLALEYPWEKWAVFLHPAQRQSVEKDYSGPARISGSAGTGKTIVALHRAVYLARTNPQARVLLTTFSDILANALHGKLRALIGSQPRLGEQIEVLSMDAIGKRLYQSNLGTLSLATQEQVRELLAEAAADEGGTKFSLLFLAAEWERVVDAWQIETWEAYRDVARLGRRTRLTEMQRAGFWQIFDKLRAKLKAAGLITKSDMFNQLAAHYAKAESPFHFAVVDEAQDVGVAQLRFLAALGGGKPNALFFAGDIGQRIFQQPFSWKSLGVDVRGRSATLRINYRTSHQIRRQADRLLGLEISDVDGNVEDRRNTISVFNGPAPQIQVFETQEQETAAVAAWLAARIEESYRPDEIAIFVRSDAQIPRAEAAVTAAKLLCFKLDEKMNSLPERLTVSTMHLAKGLEFRAVVVMACDDEVIPLQERIESVTDDSDLEDVYNTERHLLYVACTRARDSLLVTGAEPASEFLDDLRTASSA